MALGKITMIDTTDTPQTDVDFVQQAQQFTYSVVIPVYRSEAIIQQTLDRTAQFFEQQGWNYEIIAVNDGSPDGSWHKLCEKAAQNPHIHAINLLRNYGQHTAVFCGLQNSTGDWVITIDDDLQNPPEEISKLVYAALAHDYDIVYGRFAKKQHAGYRRAGSRLIAAVNERVFHKPKDLAVTNFRLMRRDVVNRICAYKTPYPYINGLSLMFSNNRGDVLVEHHARQVGSSNYNLIRILRLVMTILFNYSSYPLRFVGVVGFVASGLSFLIGVYYLFRAVIVGVSVPGWASVFIMLALASSINIIILSMLGEYVIRLLHQVSYTEIYHIRDEVNRAE
jgi:polyisoprenyl-phosphate glycosyltransferase